MTGPEVVVSARPVEISAPDWFVWDVLVAYDKYPAWNPYTVQVSTTLEIGSPMDMVLPNPDGSPGTITQREYIRIVDPPHHLRYDTGADVQGLLGTRDQRLEALGPDRCRYLSSDTFTGRYAEAAVRAHGTWMEDGFNAIAVALQARAERLWLKHTRTAGVLPTSGTAPIEPQPWVLPSA